MPKTNGPTFAHQLAADTAAAGGPVKPRPEDTGSVGKTLFDLPGSTDLTVTVDDPDWSAPGSEITVTATYPYSINIPLLGLTVTAGTITATAKERLE